jgi:hypothetical protein
MIMSRPFTPEECREMFMSHVRAMVRYWQNETRADRNEAIEGMAHSMLCMIDGVSGGLPAFQLIPYSHPDDKQYHIDNNENYWPDDVDIADAPDCLHHMLYKK